MILPIKKPDPLVPAFALFNLGFRPFFLLAGVFSVVSIYIWGGDLCLRLAGSALAVFPDVLALS